MENEDAAFERLGPVDSLYWQLEGRPTHIHLGTMGIFEDPGLSLAEIRDHVSGCLPAIPRWTQRLQEVRFGVGHPVWVDDPTFDVTAHVTEVCLPGSAGFAELYDFIGEVNSHPIDPTRPLWRMWVVRMSEQRMALVLQAHHSLADGISTWEIVTQLFDLERDAPAKSLDPVPPRPAPSDAELMRRTVADHVGTLATTARALVTSSREDLAGAARAAGHAIRYGRRGLVGPKQQTSLNAPVGHRRRFLGVRTELDAVKAIKKDNGCTVNDVVVALAAGGLRTLFDQRGELTDDMEIRVMVPVSLHPEGAASGNELGAYLVDLPIGEPDPHERLHLIAQRFDEQKAGPSLEGLRALTNVMPVLPPRLVRMVGGRLANDAYNVAISNVPGPPFPVYFRSGQMLEPFPVLPLAGKSAVAISVMSYLDRLNFGVLGDHDLVPDLDVVGQGIEAELTRLSA